MSRLWTCGFELQSVTNGVEVDTGGGAINTTTKRSGSASVNFSTDTQVKFIKHQYRSDSATAKVFMRFYINITSASTATTIMCLGNTNVDTGADGAQLYMNSDRTIQLQYWNGSQAVNIGSASSALNTGTWYRLEVSYNDADANNTAEFYLDGVLVASGNGGDLGGNGFFMLGAIDSSTVNFYVDDVAINDNTGSYQNSYPGAGNVILLRPGSAGDNTNWTPSTGNNYACIDEIPPNTTDYVASVNTTKIDDYNVSDTPAAVGASDTINVVHVGWRFASATNTQQSDLVVVRIKKAAAGTVTESSSIGTTSGTYRTNRDAAPKTYPLTLYQDTDGAAWTKTTLDSMQIGLRNPTINTARIRCTTMWVCVDYTPYVATRRRNFPLWI